MGEAPESFASAINSRGICRSEGLTHSTGTAVPIHTESVNSSTNRKDFYGIEALVSVEGETSHDGTAPVPSLTDPFTSPSQHQFTPISEGILGDGLRGRAIYLTKELAPPLQPALSHYGPKPGSPTCNMATRAVAVPHTVAFLESLSFRIAGRLPFRKVTLGGFGAQTASITPRT